MKVVDIIESLRKVPPHLQHLPLVVQGLDESGNMVTLEVTGAIRMDTTNWGPVVVLR
jgi:hypothetical protein